MDRISVVYSRKKEEADDRIIALIRKDAASTFTIVSNDNYVFNNSRAHGARVISVGEFCSLFGSQHAKTQAKSKTGEAKELSSDAARRITDEYKKHLGFK